MMKQFLCQTTRLSIWLLIASGATPTHAETVYKWVDQNNVTHYGARPPPGKNSQQVTTSEKADQPTGAKKDAPADNDNDMKAELETNESNSQAKEKQEFCARAKANYETLDKNTSVTLKDEYGNFKQLGDAERKAEKQRAKQAVDKYCLEG